MNGTLDRTCATGASTPGDGVEHCQLAHDASEDYCVAVTVGVARYCIDTAGLNNAKACIATGSTGAGTCTP